jgi:hypothetical protein
VNDLFYPGKSEGVKLAVHGGLLALSTLAAGYNLIAWVRRGESHLARNAAVYAALAVLETVQVEHHWPKP